MRLPHSNTTVRKPLRITIKLPAGERIKINEDGSTHITRNADAFVAVLDAPAVKGVSTSPSSAHAEDSFDLDEAARELEAIMEDVTLPLVLTPLPPSLTNQGEDSYN